MAGADAQSESATAAVGLTVAVSRLRARVREESGSDRTGLSVSQLALLARVIETGPTTAAALASSEHVSQQAIAQTLGTLKAEGLVLGRPDPGDGRKRLIDATAAGRQLRDALRQSKEAWLSRAIEVEIPAGERGELDRAIALIERLADSPA
jgi:DNA-binding MarR family transcriptional regulator